MRNSYNRRTEEQNRRTDWQFLTMNTADCLLFLLCGATMLQFITCYSDGSILEDECSGMNINHLDENDVKIPAQTTETPFKIIPEVQTFNNSEVETTITVSLTAINSPFTGFLLEARKCDSCPPAGTFSLIDSSSSTLLTCDGQSGRAVSHINNLDKTSITVHWQVPESGTFYFRAAFTRDYFMFWQRKPIILPTTAPTTVTTTVKATISRTVTPTLPLPSNTNSTPVTPALPLPSNTDSTLVTPALPLPSNTNSTPVTPTLPLPSNTNLTPVPSAFPATSTADSTPVTPTLPLPSNTNSTPVTPALPLPSNTNSTPVTPTLPLPSNTNSTPVTPTLPLPSNTNSTPVTPTLPLPSNTNLTPVPSAFPATSTADSTPVTPTLPLPSNTNSTPVTPTLPLPSNTNSTPVTPTLPLPSNTNSTPVPSTFPATSNTNSIPVLSTLPSQCGDYVRCVLALLLLSRLCFLDSSLLIIIRPVLKMVTMTGSVFQLAFIIVAVVLVLIRAIQYVCVCDCAGLDVAFPTLTVISMVTSLLHTITVFLHCGPSHELRKYWLYGLIIMDLLNTCITTAAIFVGLRCFQEQWLLILMGVYVIWEIMLYISQIRKDGDIQSQILEKKISPWIIMFIIFSILNVMFTIALIAGVSLERMITC
ncbi:uncharacterized protein LOC127424097 isoform X29 [Myxocyprinus asiaticus]|uniref:uncharacterized protein LOC127424097 isoform X26 n=1 Tax=Myxocyprinus asiaticus TaxID=70543 RepID=UPI002223ADB3|nr:uncharacterized protein LOC127424097 isoform X26 [Myxocyprinus asiaticus]XP_051524858.1 uncharacterized protein LOC127424097 isoform X27 [Myxocyprinus asiaticus]XP_051524859.1 uncharacterized protein LOC127424097 isoform X28 [Myxocyprinus asiaticus]XP_051524861.1 uncharacterized protein LOC127424097 isoform X29 [Myxocyprinus asiaticus]